MTPHSHCETFTEVKRCHGFQHALKYWAIIDKQTPKCHDTGLAYLPIGGEGHRRITGSKQLHQQQHNFVLKTNKHRNVGRPSCVPYQFMVREFTVFPLCHICSICVKPNHESRFALNVPQWVCCSTVTVFYAYIAK